MPAPRVPFDQLYARFNAPIADFDCGQLCAPNNPSGKPFCCDICQAVPAAYRQEWEYLQGNTNLWHRWRPEECGQPAFDPDAEIDGLPENMLLLACQGPRHCQRDFRALSCRQFPFFPFVSEDYRFIGLACYWEYEKVCWVIQHLEAVSDTYRQQFVAAFDELFDRWPDELNSYADLSLELCEVFQTRRRRVPILHRNGGFYLLSPASQRLRRAALP
ncbi:hypothetical protein [Ornatilinea apprima]|uniref:hypothetical protein n=1 Tax=Ornatilinea apprima TaxID=1134406 RepID=UPI00094625B5|nr:hypothetical protein [Ornatilinea apprima]